MTRPVMERDPPERETFAPQGCLQLPCHLEFGPDRPGSAQARVDAPARRTEMVMNGNLHREGALPEVAGDGAVICRDLP
jgi:hypothetical protein